MVVIGSDVTAHANSLKEILFYFSIITQNIKAINGIYCRVATESHIFAYISIFVVLYKSDIPQ